MLPGQYAEFYRRVQERAPSRLLVWGLGHDSALTAELQNTGGETLFVESSSVWARTIGTTHPHLRYATYEQGELGTSVSTWSSFLEQPHGLEVVSPSLRNAVVEGGGRCWDTILVDAPDGHHGQAPPRAHRGGQCPSTQRVCIASGAMLPCFCTTARQRSSARTRAGSLACRAMCCRRACARSCLAAPSARRRREGIMQSQRGCADTALRVTARGRGTPGGQS